jgi:cadmium resistance protein CadD (predicted permease)
VLLFDASLALTVFIATDIDDLLLLAVFFANARLSSGSIVCGQFAGIAVLVLVSALAALLAVQISAGWIALLGLVPLCMGLAGLWKLRAADDDDEIAESLAAEQRAETRLHSQWLAVAAVTIANGGDNLGAYIPLFARSPDLIVLYGAVFAAMTALWCALARWLVRHPFARGTVERHGNRLLPFVLIALGLVILTDARFPLQ